jgi:hypothetical protein
MLTLENQILQDQLVENLTALYGSIEFRRV